MVGNPHALERRNHLAATAGRWRHHLGYGLRDSRAALSEGRGSTGKAHDSLPICATAALHLCDAGNDCKYEKQSPSHCAVSR